MMIRLDCHVQPHQTECKLEQIADFQTPRSSLDFMFIVFCVVLQFSIKEALQTYGGMFHLQALLAYF
jgi:hypothetical protein